jgi:hypothetical protein
MDIQEVKDMTLETLRAATKNNEAFMPVVFFDGPQPAVVGCPFSDESKVPVFRKVGAMARQMHACEIYIVTDSYIRILDPKDAAWVVENWEIERPSMYPEKLRKDCLVITKIVPGDPKEEKIISIVYDKKDGEIILGEEMTVDAVDGLIKESLLEGYNQCS